MTSGNQQVLQWKQLVGLVCCALWLSGCAVVEKTLDEFKKPTASINSVSVADMSLQSVTLLFDLAVNNPNAIPLKSDGLDYNLAVSQQSLISIDRTRESIDLPARGRGNLSVPVTLNFSELYQAAASLRGRNEIDYSMELGVFFDLPLIGQFRVPVTYSASVPIPQLPKISFSAVNLQNVSLSGASIVLDLDIENGNSFDIDMSQLEYSINANGRAIGRGEIASIDMPRNNTTRISMPLDLRFNELGTTLYRLLSSNDPVNISFNGGVDLLPELGAWKPDRLNIDLSRQLTR